MLRLMSNRSRWAIVLAFGALVLALVVPVAAQAAGRITGGAKVDRSGYDARWRSIVSLRMGVDGDQQFIGDDDLWESSRDAHTCGGTLIAPDIVLTAAHC